MMLSLFKNMSYVIVILDLHMLSCVCISTFKIAYYVPKEIVIFMHFFKWFYVHMFPYLIHVDVQNRILSLFPNNIYLGHCGFKVILQKDLDFSPNYLKYSRSRTLPRILP